MAGAYAQALLVRAGKVLLVRHASGQYFGRWTGLLAPCADKELPITAAARAASQVGFSLPESALRMRAVLQFDDRSCDEKYTETVFVADLPDGDKTVAMATRHLLPAWHPIESLPLNMPDDDDHWYAAVLSERPGLVRGSFTFDEDNNLVHASVTEDTDAV